MEKNKRAKLVPISSLKKIAEDFGYDQVINVSWDKSTGVTNMATYGSDEEQCQQAAVGGNFVKKALGWPESLQEAIPSSAKKKIKKEVNRILYFLIFDLLKVDSNPTDILATDLWKEHGLNLKECEKTLDKEKFEKVKTLFQ